MSAYRLIAPALVLTAAALVQFTLDAFCAPSSSKRPTVSFGTAVIGVLAALFLIPGAINSTLYGRGMLIADGLSSALGAVSLLVTLLVIFLSVQDKTLEAQSAAVYYGLLLLSAAGLILAVSANDFLVILLAIELVGIPAFILTAFQRKSSKAGEAAIKFFLIGAFSSAMLAYGVSLLYGILGSTSLTALAQNLPMLQDKAPVTLLAIFFIIVSFGFKIAMVPFHMWVPDTFEGAPVPIAGYLSAAPKMVGIGLALRVFTLAMPESFHGSTKLLAVLAALTMTVANVVGLQQRNVVRLLAYSSIAHMGYALLGLVAGGSEGIASVYLYGFAYLFMNLGAFSIVLLIQNATGSTDLDAFAGLGKRSPALGALMVLLLISLAGLPPTAGFIAKFYVFSAAYHSGWFWLLGIAALNSVISVGYYFKILHAMYFRTPSDNSPVPVTLAGRIVLAATSFATLLFGLVPQAALIQVRSLAPASSVSVSAPEATSTTDHP